jgi:hypothetical protein
MKEGKFVQQDLGNGKVKLDFMHLIDESFMFPDSLPSGLKEIDIDLGQMVYINSMGLRRWVSWIIGLVQSQPGARLVISRPTLAYIRSVEVIRECLPPKALVMNFYVDLYCDGCNNEHSILMENKKGLKIPETPCPKCGTIMDTEIAPEAFEPLINQAPN